MATRIVSWNVAFRSSEAARRQGEFLAELKPSLVLLQEVNPQSSEALADEGGLDWLVRAVDLREPQPGDTPVRRRGVAIGGTGPRPTRTYLLDGVRLPERMLIAALQLEGLAAHAISYHAPPGVNYGIEKPRQAFRCVKWLASTRGPIVLGADANTPEYDMPDFQLSRTHWHTGMRKLRGEPGDDLLFGPGNNHRLTDALRAWLDWHPQQLEEIRSLRPNGPLAVSHLTGRRKDFAGVDRRFDSIWLTPDFYVEAVNYPYEESLLAGSDHSAVVVDITSALRAP
jgi:hypothetical protein